MEQDLLAILDELERLVDDAGHIPLTGKVVVDEEAVYAILDRLRAAIPEALHQAQRIHRERERILSQARDEAEALIQEAKAYAARLTSESSITQRATEEAERILEEARRMSREIRVGAREYASELLGKVEASLERCLAAVHAGQAELGAPRPAGDEEPQRQVR
ncbi:MAG: ATPase [Clostridia bacterium]|nr:ATPase [Clostridia bacterium]